MKKIVVLDLHGVVFFPIDKMVILTALQKYNLAKSAALFACYKTQIAKKFVEKNLNDILYDCSLNVPYIPGALSAVEQIQNIPDTKIHICSKGTFSEMSKKLEQFYRIKSPIFNAVSDYSLVSPFDSKRPVISNVCHHNTEKADIYVVDDTPKNLEMSYDLSLNSVLISTNAADIKRAKRKYNAINFSSLAEFAKYLSRQK